MLIPHYEAIQSVSESDRLTKINRFSSPRMFVDHYVLQQGQSQRPHTHAENDKLYLVLEGTGTFTVGQDVFILAAGEGCVAPAGILHGVANDEPDRLILLVTMAPNI